MSKKISASKARNNFFDMLDKAYLKGEDYVIEKSGIPVARLMRFDENDDFDLKDFAGSWKDIDTKDMKKYIKEGRKDKKSKKVLKI